MAFGLRYFAASFVIFCSGLLLPFQQASGADTDCWTRYFGEPGSVITDVVSNPQGIWIAGRIAEEGSSPTLWIALLDSKGRVQWQQRLPATGYQLYPRLSSSLESMWVIAETPLPSVPAPGGGSVTASQVWIGKINLDGQLISQQTLAPHRVNTVQAASGIEDGGVLLAGLVETGADMHSRGWIAQLDREGKLIRQQILPQVSWLSSLKKMETDQWLIAGTAHEKEGDQRPWLAVVNRRGDIQQSWKPDIQGFCLYSALAVSNDFWLAGEWTAARSGAGLIRMDRTSGRVTEYSATGFSMLRLLAVEPRGLLAGGDGMGENQPAAPESAPGWLSLDPGGMESHMRSQKIPEAPAKVSRLRHLPCGELHAWTFCAPDRIVSDRLMLIGAGATIARGAWVGCIRPMYINPDNPVPHAAPKSVK